MSRHIFAFALILASGSHGLADAFDRYTNPILDQVPGAPATKAVTELTPEMIVEHEGVLPQVSGTFVVVRTNQGRWAKLIVKAARQKFAIAPGTEPIVLPIFRVERYVTFREATERAIQAEGKNLSLFSDTRFHLDLGQIVPAKLQGDIHVVELAPNRFVVKPIGKAKLYLVIKPLHATGEKGGDKFEPGSKVESKHFGGTYRLFDDGRRAGVLRLKVNPDNDVSGTFISDRDGAEYEVRGAAGNPVHKIRFTIKFPQTEPSYEGMLFTGDAKAIAGTSKLIERESAFYAVRVEE